jgi:hypothetical protein
MFIAYVSNRLTPISQCCMFTITSSLMAWPIYQIICVSKIVATSFYKTIRLIKLYILSCQYYKLITHIVRTLTTCWKYNCINCSQTQVIFTIMLDSGNILNMYKMCIFIIILDFSSNTLKGQSMHYSVYKLFLTRKKIIKNTLWITIKVF